MVQVRAGPQPARVPCPRVPGPLSPRSGPSPAAPGRAGLSPRSRRSRTTAPGPAGAAAPLAAGHVRRGARPIRAAGTRLGNFGEFQKAPGGGGRGRSRTGSYCHSRSGSYRRSQSCSPSALLNTPPSMFKDLQSHAQGTASSEVLNV